VPASAIHMYVFVNVGKRNRADYIVVPSKNVAAKSLPENGGSRWPSFKKSDRPSALYKSPDSEGWELFGDPHGSIAAKPKPRMR
jgi:hypothetical protein